MPTMGKQNAQRFSRKQNPPPMRFQSRDGDILNAIHSHDGVLARRQIKTLFWPNTSCQAMEHRLSVLFHNGYLDWPNQAHRCTKPIPEPIVWLGWKGILWIAGQKKIYNKPPYNPRENQLRLLSKKLRSDGIRWVREPRWIQLAHDLAIADIRISIEKSVNKMPSFNLDVWLPEGEFRSNVDVIEFTSKCQDGKYRRLKKGILPDSYFVIKNRKLNHEGKPARARFLLELDNATHPNRRFGLEKVLPGVAYIHSQAYKERFGFNAGHWLVVTTGEVRMKNIMQQAKVRAGEEANLFFFTTLEKAINHNVLLSPIWRQVGDNQPKPLIVE